MKIIPAAFAVILLAGCGGTTSVDTPIIGGPTVNTQRIDEPIINESFIDELSIDEPVNDLVIAYSEIVLDRWSPDHVWVPAHYQFKKGRYVWVKGHYQHAPRYRTKWVSGHTRKTQRGKIWVNDHWK